jgi:4-hydroxybenzoate polyprenyltransferase
VAGSVVAGGVLLGSAALLNPLCLALSPAAVIPLIVYPYAKRFTNLPHAVLGLAQAIAPIGAWIAVTGSFHGAAPALLLGLAVGCWIGGFDLIYACQDAEVAFGLLLWFGATAGYGWLWYLGLAATAAAFCYEHAIVRADDLSRVNRAFFTANGFVALVLFAFALADLVAVHGLHP